MVLDPNLEKGTPKIYKQLAYECMSANPKERPKVEKWYKILDFWCYSNEGFNDEKEKLGYKSKEVRVAFEEAKEISNISTSYEKNSDAVYTSRAFTFSKLLPKPVNSSIITSYVNNEENNEGRLSF